MLRRIVATAGVGALVLALSACFPTLRPSTPAPLDVAAIEETMLGIMPPAPEGFTSEEETGLDGETFGSGWADVDYEASRVARAQRTFESLGWHDPSQGPGIWVELQVVRMESVAVADATMEALAGAVAQPYTLDNPDGGSQGQYAPLVPPTGRWPSGALEQDYRLTWSSGVQAAGWIAYSGSGPYIILVTALAMPDEGAPAARDAFVDIWLPILLDAVGRLSSEERG